MTAASVVHRFRRVAADGDAASLTRPIAVEQPVAVEYGGLGYAVTMASPSDLIDFAHGYTLAERIADGPGAIVDVDVAAVPLGTILRVTLTPEAQARVTDRVRQRMAGASCGLCGIENLEQALRPLPVVAAGPGVGQAAVFRAIAAMRARQPLNRETGAVHGAMACSAAGDILIVREDVGRHNAFDKLIGAMMRDGQGWNGGFALLSSRCSYELVEKAALAGCPMLVTVSAATDLALVRAAEAGIILVSLAREDAVLWRD